MVNPYLLIMELSAIVMISFVLSRLSRRTGVPTVILLIGFGMLLGAVLPPSFLDVDEIMQPLKVIGTVGLMLIVLEGALDLQVTREKLGDIGQALLSATMILVVTAGVITGLLMALFEMEFMSAVVYSLPLSIVSSAIVIPSVHRLYPAKREFLIYESTFSDILGIMLFDFIVFEPPIPGLHPGAAYTIATLGSILLAAVTGLLLILLFQRVGGVARHVFFLSILTFILAAGKFFHLPTLLIILVFGLLLNNGYFFFRKNNFIGRLADPEELNLIRSEFFMITEEASFLIRTIFFVVFGISLNASGLLDPTVLLAGGGVIVAIYLVRYINLKVITHISVWPQILIAPRGLITILLYYKIPESYKTDAFPEPVLVFVILVSSLLMMVGLLKSGDRESDLHRPHEEHM